MLYLNQCSIAHEACVMLQVRAIEEMQADPNVKPDLACINAMVDAYQRLGDMAAAEALLPQAASLASQQGPLSAPPCPFTCQWLKLVESASFKQGWS